MRQEILVQMKDRKDRHQFNSMKTAGKFFQTLKAPCEKMSELSEAGHLKSNVKVGQLKKLNDYVNPILTDMDPSQYIEDEYKHYK